LEPRIKRKDRSGGNMLIGTNQKKCAQPTSLNPRSVNKILF
jgi:hypothetical protein